MHVVQPRISYTELLRSPEDGRRYEIYDGEVFVVPSPLPRHQMASKALLRVLDRYATLTGGIALAAPLDVVFSEYDVAQPDLVFFARDRRHLVDPNVPIRHAPDLAVEMLSPTTADTKRGKKMQLFARYGVREYWIVDPVAARIEVRVLQRDGTYRLDADLTGDATARSPSFEGLSFEAAEIFRLD